MLDTRYSASSAPAEIICTLQAPSPTRTGPCMPQPNTLWKYPDNLWFGLFFHPGSKENNSFEWNWRKPEMKGLDLLLDIELFFACSCQVSRDIRKHYKDFFPCRSCAYPVICISFPISLMLLLSSCYQRVSKETSRARFLYPLEIQWKGYDWFSRNAGEGLRQK